MDIGWPLKQPLHLCSVVYYLLERRLAGIDDRQAYVTHGADVGPLWTEKHCVPTQIPRLTNVPALQCGRLPFSCVVSESCEENPCLPHICKWMCLCFVKLSNPLRLPFRNMILNDSLPRALSEQALMAGTLG